MKSLRTQHLALSIWENTRGGPGRVLRGSYRWVVGAVLGPWNSLAVGQVRPVLTFPKESDRMMVLISAAVMIGGMALIVNQLRKRAERRREE